MEMHGCRKALAQFISLVPAAQHEFSSTIEYKFRLGLAANVRIAATRIYALIHCSDFSTHFSHLWLNLVPLRRAVLAAACVLSNAVAHC